MHHCWAAINLMRFLRGSNEGVCTMSTTGSQLWQVKFWQQCCSQFQVLCDVMLCWLVNSTQHCEETVVPVTSGSSSPRTVPVNAKKTYGGGEIVPLILNLSIKCRWVQSSCSSHFTHLDRASGTHCAGYWVGPYNMSDITSVILHHYVYNCFINHVSNRTCWYICHVHTKFHMHSCSSCVLLISSWKFNADFMQQFYVYFKKYIYFSSLYYHTSLHNPVLMSTSVWSH
jgi:hypothetical protein